MVFSVLISNQTFDRMNILIKTIGTFALLIMCAFYVNAQSLTVENSTTKYDDKNVAAVKVVMNPSPEKVKEEFKDYMKDKYDVKLKGIGFLANRDVMYAEQVDIPAVSNKTMDFRTKVVERGEATEMTVFGSFGYDMDISPERFPNEYQELKEITVNFLNQFLPNYYQDRIDETQEMLTDLTKDREKLQDDIKDNEKEIKELQKENEENQKNLEELNSKITEAETKLKTREKNLQKINTELIRN